MTAITLTPSTAAPGDSVTVAGTGFGTHKTVNVSLDGHMFHALCSAADGPFSFAFTVPAEPNGAHTVSATSTSGTASATLTVTGGSSPSGPTVPPGSTLLFLDDFLTAGLSTAKWNHPSLFHCCGTPVSSGGFVAGYDGPISVPGDGYAYLSAIRDVSVSSHWHVPIMDTKSKAQFTPTTGGGHGVHLEVRAKIPKGRGVWPAALWLYGPAGGAPEIDVNETLANLVGTEPFAEGDVTWDLVHVHYSGGQFGAGAQAAGTPELSADFHLFGSDWYADRVLFYLDGTLIATFAPSNHAQVPAGPLYLLTDVGISNGADWAGNLAADGTTPSPSTMVLDYVAVWTLP